MSEQQWQRWFAWYPVSLVYEIDEGNGYSYAPAGEWAWLRAVERRRTQGSWEYRVTLHIAPKINPGCGEGR